MKTIETILFEDNKTSVTNVAKLKELSQMIRKAFEPFGIRLKMDDEASFFEALIQYEGLKNKQMLEATFEAERHELSEIWPNITYQERNKLVNIKINDLKNSLRYFKNDKNKIIWIPFFDELLNALYHNEMAIFDLDQYYRLYKHFKERLIPVKTYGLAPYTSDFMDITDLISGSDHRIFYYHPLKSIFILDASLRLKRIPLSKSMCQVHPLNRDLIQLANAVMSGDEKIYLNTLMTSPLISDKVKLKLNKVYKNVLIEKESK